VRASIDNHDASMENTATKGDIEAAKSDILKWMFGGFIATITMLAGLILKFVH